MCHGPAAGVVGKAHPGVVDFVLVVENEHLLAVFPGQFQGNLPVVKIVLKVTGRDVTDAADFMRGGRRDGYFPTVTLQHGVQFRDEGFGLSLGTMTCQLHQLDVGSAYIGAEVVPDVFLPVDVQGSLAFASQRREPHVLCGALPCPQRLQYLFQGVLVNRIVHRPKIFYIFLHSTA